MSSHGGKGEGSLWDLFHKDTNLIYEGSTLRISTCEFGVDTNIQTMAVVSGCVWESGDINDQNSFVNSVWKSCICLFPRSKVS